MGLSRDHRLSPTRTIRTRCQGSRLLHCTRCDGRPDGGFACLRSEHPSCGTTNLDTGEKAMKVTQKLYELGQSMTPHSFRTARGSIRNRKPALAFQTNSPRQEQARAIITIPPYDSFFRCAIP